MRMFASTMVCLALAGCDGKMSVGSDSRPNADVEKTCPLVANGMTVTEVDALMVGAGRLSSNETDDGKVRNADVVYWSTSDGAAEYKSDPNRLFTPHDKTCTVRFDSVERVSEARYRFVEMEELESIMRDPH